MKYAFRDNDAYKTFVEAIRNADDQDALAETFQFAGEIHDFGFTQGYWRAMEDAMQQMTQIIEHMENSKNLMRMKMNEKDLPF